MWLSSLKMNRLNNVFPIGDRVETAAIVPSPIPVSRAASRAARTICSIIQTTSSTITNCSSSNSSSRRPCSSSKSTSNSIGPNH